jgi:hypothetical protein
VSAPGAKRSTDQATALNEQIRRLRDKEARLRVLGTPQAIAQANAVRVALSRLVSKRITVQIDRVLTGVSSSTKGLADSLTMKRKSKPNARGGLYAAAGGVAQVAPPGTLYQWAEPETGGEAFIPRRGDKRRSRAIASTVVEDWLGGQVVWPMAKGGIMSFATGGTTVPLADFMSRYTPSSFSSAADVRQASRGQANAVDSLRVAERRLSEDRKRHASAAKIAADEAAVAKARRSLAAATEKLTNVQTSYSMSKGSPVARFQHAVNMGVKNSGAFLANLQKLADRGFRDLALRLLDMGGPEAETVAAGAVKLSSSALGAMSQKIETAANQQSQLQYFGQISAARSAVRQGQSSFAALASATGSSDEDLAAALRLIADELGKTRAGTALLEDMRRYGYAAGGIAPPGTRYRWAEPSTGGEALVPRFGGGAAAKAVLSTAAGWYGMQLASSTARPQSPAVVDNSVTNIHTVPMNAAELNRELETAKRWRSGRH